MSNSIAAKIAPLFLFLGLIVSCSKPIQGNDAGLESVIRQKDLKQAQLSSASDGLLRLFPTSRRLLLDKSLLQVTRLAVLGDDTLVILDARQKSVVLVDKTGKIIRTIGSIGSGPGKFTQPIDVATYSGKIAILDAVARRVNIFDSSGNFVSSFVYGMQHFMATRLIFSDGSFILFGSQLQAGGPAETALLAHAYTASGEYIASKLPYTDSDHRNLLHYEGPIASLDERSQVVSVMFPFSDSLYSFVRSDSDIHKTRLPIKFKPPTTPFDPKSGDTFLRSVHDWEATWTPVVAFTTVGGASLIETQDFSPLRYRLEVCSQSPAQCQSLQTNYLFKARGNDNDLWFIDGLPKNGSEAQNNGITLIAVKKSR